MFTEYSLWWLMPIILISLTGSTILYFYTKKKTYTKRQSIILFSLRSLAFFLTFFLFIAPTIKHKKDIVQKPIVVIAQDNSSSLLMTKDSNFYKGEYLKKIENLAKALDEDYEVKFIKFGSGAKEINNDDIKKINYKDYATDISDALLRIQDKYSNLNLSSIILCTDGIINKGNNPLNLIDDLQIPVFTVAMGDTTIKKDLAISEVRYNRMAYLKNKFPLEIVAIAQKAKGSSSIVRVKKDGKTLFEEHFLIDNDNFSKSFSTTLTAEKVGLQRYTIELQTIENEQTTANNIRDIFVEVLDGRQKILLVGNSPHPDMSAIKQSIETNENYEVKTILFNDFPASLKDYNIAILHQIPASNPQQLKAIERLKEANIPILYVIGSQTNISYFNSLSTGIVINNSKVNPNSATAFANTNFTLFSISKETETILNQFPPLLSPFGTYNLSPVTQSLVNQKIGTVQTNYPLIAFTNNPNQRSGAIVGEGFWRWRLQNYLINKTHNQTDEIIHKSIQYLASKLDKSRFRIICDNVFAENQPIIMDAELYNDSYELVNEPDVKIVITNPDGKKFPFTFSKTINAYHLYVGTFPSGKYDYTATTIYGGKTFVVNGVFHISTQNLEAINIVADHNLLFNISEKTSAQMLYPNQIDKLQNLLKKRKDIKPLIHQTITNDKLIDLWWYLALIILIFASEWFLRKYWGKI